MTELSTAASASTSASRARAHRILRNLAILLAAGRLYSIPASFGLGLPCVFHEMTGLKCPGCGATHMCLALMRLNFREAFAANQALFILSPFIFIYAVRRIIRYIQTGEDKTTRGENSFLIAVLVVLIAFGIFRNIFQF